MLCYFILINYIVINNNNLLYKKITLYNITYQMLNIKPTGVNQILKNNVYYKTIKLISVLNSYKKIFELITSIPCNKW